MKKIFLMGLSLVLVAVLAIGGTFAYLTDTDETVNVMTLGNVDIEQHEYERVVDADGNYTTINVNSTTSYELKDFTQGKPLLPATALDPNGQPYNYGAGDWDSTLVKMSQVDSHGSMQVFVNKNAQDKFVTVENKGKTDAYVRTLIAFEIGSLAETEFDNVIGTSSFMTDQDVWKVTDIGIAEIDGNNYSVCEYIYEGAKALGGVHENGVLPAGDTTYPSLAQVYMKAAATNEDVEKIDGNGNGTYDILVLSQAVQVDGFADAETALKAGFGEANAANVQAWFGGMEPPTTAATADDLAAALENGGSAVLTEDIKDAPVNTTAPYGNSYGVAQNGGVLDGNGKTLDFDAPNGDNYGVMTSGGTIKNVTITGVFRGIMIMDPTEDVIIDNVTIGDEEVCYAINTGEGDGTHDLIVKNSTLKGWNSYGTAIKSVSFTNCIFAQGEYYNNVFGRLTKPYVDAVYENCEFNSYYYIDLSQLGKDGDGNVLNPNAKITLKNCTVNGVKLTADNWTSLIATEDNCGVGQISIEGKDGSYMTASNVFDYVIIK